MEMVINLNISKENAKKVENVLKFLGKLENFVN
jgi:hypothetical protein